MLGWLLLLVKNQKSTFDLALGKVFARVGEHARPCPCIAAVL